MRNPKLNRYIPPTLLLILSIVLVYASVFVYHPVSVNIQGLYPTLTFTSPPYSYTCTALVRTSRGAVTYTDFETYPVPGWTNRGGKNFGLVAGHKGYALQFVDDGKGLGDASQYYYNTILDTYTSLWVEVKVKHGSADKVYLGIILMNAKRDRAYEASIYYVRGQPSATAYLRSYNVEKGGAWSDLNSTTISNYNPNDWYTIVLFYNVTANSVDLYMWVYDSSGSQVAYLTYRSTAKYRFTPAYIGVEINDDKKYQPVVFDDFIISTVDPRNVLFMNLQSGLIFNIYDNLGSLTYSFTATTSNYILSVIPDVVLGTGTDGNMQILYPDGSLLCLNVSIPATDAFLGGDSYNLSTKNLTWSIGSSATSASVSAYISSNANQKTSLYAIALTASQGYYVQLQLDTSSSTISQSLNAQIYIQGGTQPITIVNGTVNPAVTDWVYIPAGSTKYIIVPNAYASPGSISTLILNVVACTNGRLNIDPAPGACVFYPLTIILTAV